jgi:hypothetical protein
MQNEQIGKQVELGNRIVGRVELPSVDVSPYIGKKSKIELVETFEGNYGYYVRVSTEVVDTIGTGDKAIKLRGTRVFGLHEDANGNIGWNENTKFGVFLKKYGAFDCKNFDEVRAALTQKEVILQSTTSEKDGKDYLSFN